VTPPYVDPTVARGGAPGPASDVFGIAAAAFQALTGVAPWNAATPADTLVVAADGQLPDLAELAPDAPAELLAVVARGLSADPHDRGTAAAFALDLRHACRPEPVRLPVDGVPDTDLALTGRGPRTELTHQVPGRRPRPAPVAAGPVGRRAAWRAAVEEWWGVRVRPSSGRLAVLGLALVALATAGWLGLRWTGASDTAPVGSDASVVAATSELPAPSSTPAATPSGATATPPPVDAPDSLEGWRAVVSELYGRRAAAFGTATADGLDDVYAPGSVQLAADRQYVTALAGAGQVLQGFRPVVDEVTAAVPDGDRVQLTLVDRWPDYAVVAGDRVLSAVAGRAAAEVRMVIVRTAEGWRISTAQRTG